MIIEIKGVQFVNKGAELMLHAILQQIRARFPTAEVALAPNPNSPYSERSRLGAYQKLSISKNIVDLNRFAYWLPRRLRNWLKHHWGVVTEADIDVVLDASGFAYGDQWGRLPIVKLSRELDRAKKNGKKYIFLPQAFGPFFNARSSLLLRRSLRNATYIFAREETSFNYIRSLDNDIRNIEIFPDFTNLVNAEVPEYCQNGYERVLIVPNYNMVGARNNHLEWKENYLEFLIMSVNVIREIGLEPVLLNHEGCEDEAICRMVVDAVEGCVEVINEPDPIKVKGIIGSSKAVICSRFHACVSALSQGVACLGTSWTHKYERLFEEYGREEFLMVPGMTKMELRLSLEKALTVAETQVNQNCKKFSMQTEEMWRKIHRLI